MAPSRRQTRKGRDHRREAKIADRSRERGAPPQPLGADNAARPSHEKRLTHGAQRTPPMRAAAKRRSHAELWCGVGPRRKVYGALVGRLTAERRALRWSSKA